MGTEEQLDFTKLRYVLYARKSSEDEQGQKHSIEDQVTECKKFAERNNLNIVEVITEQKSAKIVNNRPKFSTMLKDFRKKKYDGILAWHPDRLARNMLEAGMIIDDIDSGVIKDLKFCQHNFENNASGKMMLGMLFVFSKQYSDALSERVTRGIRSNLRERGISSGTRKWGYCIDDDGHYKPDENFEPIQKAWSLRIDDGWSCKKIHGYLKERNVRRITKETKKVQSISETTVENIFKDSFYYGELQQGDDTVHLGEHYDFKPMITREMFDKAQTIGYAHNKKYNLNSKKYYHIFKPLADMVICGECGHKMKVTRSMPGDKSGWILYYRCTNKKCTRKQKGTPAQVIFNQIYELFDNLQFTEESYKQYEEQISFITEKKLTELKTERASNEAVIRNLSNRIDGIAGQLEKATSQVLIDRLNNTAEEIQKDISNCRDRNAEIKNILDNSSRMKVSREDFLNLMNNIGEKMRAADIIQKDEICRKVFLNLVLDDQKKAHL